MKPRLVTEIGSDSTQFRKDVGELPTIVNQSWQKMEAASKPKEGGLDDNVKGLKRGFNDLKSILVAGGITTAVKSFFSLAIEQANKCTDATDESAAAVRRFGAAAASVKEGFADMSVKVVGFFNQAGENIGWLINRIRGVSEAQEAAMEKIATDTVKNLETIAAAKKKFEAENSPEKIAAAEEKLAQQRRANAMAQMDEGAKYVQLLGERQKLEDQIANTANKNTVAYINLLTDLEKKEAEIGTARAKLAREEASRVDAALSDAFELLDARQRALEAANSPAPKPATPRPQPGPAAGPATPTTPPPADETPEQKAARRRDAEAGLHQRTQNALGAFLGAAVGSAPDLSDLSADQLRAIVSRNRKAIQSEGSRALSGPEVASGNLSGGIRVAQLQLEMGEALKELNQRMGSVDGILQKVFRKTA